MQEAIQKAAVLIEAHEYIRQFEGKAVVVTVGGSIMDDPDALRSLLRDVCFLDAVGIHPVLVHGGGKAISQAMAAEGIEAQFVQGRRYTDERTLAIAEHVLINEVNRFIVDHIQSLEHRAMGLHSLASGKLNVNADSAAGQVAAALKAEKLVLVSDTHGIRTGAGADSLAKHLSRPQIQDLIDRGVVAEGMLPKVEAAFAALDAGVRKTHIIDGRIPHSLLLEIFSTEGIGTEIVLE